MSIILHIIYVYTDIYIYITCNIHNTLKREKSYSYCYNYQIYIKLYKAFNLLYYIDVLHIYILTFIHYQYQ